MTPASGDPSGPLAIDTELGAEDSARLTAAGELDIATVPQLERVLGSLLARGAREVAIDLSQVTFIDSSALRMFIVLHGRAAREGWSVRIVDPSEQARAVFEITGADQHLRVESERSRKEST
jgi:anti-sigma B factor antagonist